MKRNFSKKNKPAQDSDSKHATNENSNNENTEDFFSKSNCIIGQPCPSDENSSSSSSTSDPGDPSSSSSSSPSSSGSSSSSPSVACEGECPADPMPIPSDGGCGCDGNQCSVNMADGATIQSHPTLQCPASNIEFTYFNQHVSASGAAENPNVGLGSNWTTEQHAHLVEKDECTVYATFKPGRSGRTYWFAKQPDDSYEGCYGTNTTLIRANPFDDWRMHEPDGTVTIFANSTGKILSQIDPGGQTTEYIYDSGTGDLTDVKKTLDNGDIINYEFEYNANGVSTITHQIISGSTTTNVARIKTSFYTQDLAGKGSEGDLKTLKEQRHDGSSWVTSCTYYFRYYTDGLGNGFKHGMKYALLPDGYDRMTDPINATDAELADHASDYYEYDSERRVTKSTTAGGTFENNIVYSENNTSARGYNDWLRKAVLTLPNNTTKTVYANFIAQDVFVVDEDNSDNERFSYTVRNADNRVIESMGTSAIDISGTPYDESEDDLNVQIKPSDGLINVTTYYTSTGNGAAKGYPEFQMVKKGSSGSEIKISKTEYIERSIGSGVTAVKIYPVSMQTIYRSDSGGGDPVTTDYSYTWHTDTVQMETMTTSLPDVPAAENGVNFPQSDTVVVEYDLDGRVVEETDARGTVTSYEFDSLTGGQINMIADDGGFGLETDYTFDDEGRVTESMGPEHEVDGTTVRTTEWTIYNDDIHQVISARGYTAGASKTLMNPVTIQNMDCDGRTVETIQATRGSGVYDSGALSESDTFPQSSWVRLSRQTYDDAGRMTSSRVYHTIPASGVGTININYEETTYGYDAMNRQNRVEIPGGTITQTVFDDFGQTVSSWVGTDDTSATDSDPTGGGATGNNMKKVSENEYDGGSVGGDGLLTKVTRPVDDTTANDRVTEMEYDWRNRQTVTTTSDGTNTFEQSVTLDNLGRATVNESHRDDSGTLVLTAKSESFHDTRGRVYQSKNYAVSDAGVAGNSLVSNTWFNENGAVIKSQSPGSDAFSKMTYDDLGRMTASYTAYYDGTGSDDPESLVDNVVIQQSEPTYNEVGQVTFSTSRSRYHDTTGTGALLGPNSTAPKSRDRYTAIWYDEIGRQTAIANYGTNDDVVPTRPSSAPASSDDVPVSQTSYTEHGAVKDQTDAAGKSTRSFYDDMGRTTKVVNNHGSTPLEVVRTEYNSDGQVHKLIAENADTGNQVTTYTYGVTTTGSEIASNDLLQKVKHADDGEVEYEYDRQGSQIKMTDQNGSVHETEYDKSGRSIVDKVSTLGSGVNGDVRRIERDFDDRGRLEKVTCYDAVTSGSIESQIQYEYNDFGQVETEYQQHGSAVNTSTSPKTTYTYANGTANSIRRESMTYPNGEVLNYDYGTAGEINDILSRTAGLEFDSTDVVSYDYLGMGQVVHLEYPEANVNWTVTQNSGDPYGRMDRFGRLTNLYWRKSTTSQRVNVDYGYDRMNNRLFQRDHKALSNSKYYDELYGYDDLNRLVSYDRGELDTGDTTISNTTLNQDWTLDETGNFTDFDQVDSVTLNQSRTHSKTNEISNITETSGPSWATPAHDDNGNMTTIPQPNDLPSSFDATYDAWNRLVKLMDGTDTIGIYGYDGLGRRITKTTYEEGGLPFSTEQGASRESTRSLSLGRGRSLSDGEGDSEKKEVSTRALVPVVRHFYYSDQFQVLEVRIDTSSDPDRQFVWGTRYIDDLVLRDRDTTDNGTLDERHYSLADARFSVVAIVNTSGTLRERYAYDAYGQMKAMTSVYVDRSESSYEWERHYTGQTYDLESALYYFRARYYHSEQGRFISRDPLGFVDGMSLYQGYFNPNQTDHDGMRIMIFFRPNLRTMPIPRVNPGRIVPVPNTPRTVPTVPTVPRTVPMVPKPKPNPKPKLPPLVPRPPRWAPGARPIPPLLEPEMSKTDLQRRLDRQRRYCPKSSSEPTPDPTPQPQPQPNPNPLRPTPRRPRETCEEKWGVGVPICPDKLVTFDKDEACNICNEGSNWQADNGRPVDPRKLRGYFGTNTQRHYNCFVPPRKQNGIGIGIVCGTCCDDSSGIAIQRYGCTCQTKGGRL